MPGVPGEIQATTQVVVLISARYLEPRFELEGEAQVRTGMSVQELAPINEFRASEAHLAGRTSGSLMTPVVVILPLFYIRGS